MAAYDFGPIHTHLPHLQPFRDHTAAPVAHVATAMMMPLHLLETEGSNMHCLPHSHRINSKLHRSSARYLLAHTSHCKALLIYISEIHGNSQQLLNAAQFLSPTMSKLTSRTPRTQLPATSAALSLQGVLPPAHG
jgi:hypothetical protein